jgi:ketosteroid isomerase-like protein
MSEENVEILRGIYSEMARGNFWALGPFLDPEVEWIWAPKFQGIVGERVFHGPGGVEAATRELFEAWERYTLEAEEFIDAGDSVIVVSRGRGRSKRGGPDVEHWIAALWAFRGGKVVRMTGYESRADAMEAAGLRE